MDDLEYKFQGQLMSNVKTDLNSHHLVSYLLPLQYGHLSLTVWSQHAINYLHGNPIPTPNFGGRTPPKSKDAKFGPPKDSVLLVMMNDGLNLLLVKYQTAEPSSFSRLGTGTRGGVTQKTNINNMLQN